MKHSIIAFCIICSIAYLLGCFIAVSFDISEWDRFLRTMMGVCGVLFGFLAAGIVMDIKNNN